MLIRHAHSGDCDTLVELSQQLGYEISPDDVAANLYEYEKVHGFVFVTEEDGALIGFVSGTFIPLFHKREMMCRITALCVREQNRKAGIGRALLEKVEELCSNKECSYIEVTSGAHREKVAHPFYEAMGYVAYDGKRYMKTLG
jgi:GNAT superfamily N-acetyltransferase